MGIPTTCPADVWGPCPVAKPREGLLQTGGQDPCLRPKQEHSLHHRHIEPPRSSHIRYLPYQDLCQTPPFPCALRRFRSTAGQLSSMDNKVRPKYRNKETDVSGVPYFEKTCPICSSVSLTSNFLSFLYVPIRHITEIRCYQLRDSCGTSMSHWGHRGWG